MSVLIRRAVEMLMTTKEYEQAMALIARKERQFKKMVLEAENHLLRSLGRPATEPPTPYRAPTQPTVFFTSGWKTVTAEVIEAMAEDDEINDLVLGLATVDPLEEVIARHDVTPPPARRGKFRRITKVRPTDPKRTYKGRKYEKNLPMAA